MVTLGQVCEAAYVCSKRAKECADMSRDAYDSGKHQQAKAYSAKKEFLYGLKAKLLDVVYSKHDVCEIHIISQKQYYYLEFTTENSPSHDSKHTWKFHLPITTENFESVIVDNDVSVKTVNNFSSSRSVEQSNMNLYHVKQIIEHIDSIEPQTVITRDTMFDIEVCPSVDLWK